LHWVPIGSLVVHEDFIPACVDRLEAYVSMHDEFPLLLVDRDSGCILDGHHRYQYGLRHGLQYLPAIQCDYLNEPELTVTVWPTSAMKSVDKLAVINMGLSGSTFSAKTTRHGSDSREFAHKAVPLVHVKAVQAREEARAFPLSQLEQQQLSFTSRPDAKRQSRTKAEENQRPTDQSTPHLLAVWLVLAGNIVASSVHSMLGKLTRPTALASESQVVWALFAPATGKLATIIFAIIRIRRRSKIQWSWLDPKLVSKNTYSTANPSTPSSRIPSYEPSLRDLTTRRAVATMLSEAIYSASMLLAMFFLPAVVVQITLQLSFLIVLGVLPARLEGYQE
jgi:FtsH-binding integral membrane protein